MNDDSSIVLRDAREPPPVGFAVRPVDEPITFVIERHNGQEYPSVVYGKLPGRLREKLHDGNRKLVVAIRLDTMPNAEQLLKMPVCCLYSEFCLRRSL